MLTPSNAACIAAGKTFEAAMRRQLDVLVRMETPSDDSFLRDLPKIAGDIWPIYDPLVREVCERVKQTLSIPRAAREAIEGSIQFMVHFWYGALKEEEFLSGQGVPLLRRQRVEEILPSLLADKQIDQKLPRDGLGNLYQAMQGLIQEVAAIHPGGALGRDLSEQVFLRPLLVLNYLLNDAATAE